MPNPVKIQVRVESIQKIDESVYSVYMRPLTRKPRFYAGQFLHLALDTYDPTGGYWPESRVFSIASSPKSDLIQIVYSVKGVYTRRMEKELPVTSELWLKFPYGHFIIPQFIDDGVSRIVIIAGGTGISPFLPFLNDSASSGVSVPVKLYWGAKSPEVFSIGEGIVSNTIPNLEHTLFCESETYNKIERCRFGKICMDTIWKENGTDSGCKYFISGPPQMIQVFKKYLIERNVDENRIIVDDWE